MHPFLCGVDERPIVNVRTVMIDDLEMMEIQTEMRFIHDPNGRLRYINQLGSEKQSVPRFFLGRTRAGNIRRFRDDLPDKIIKQLDELATIEPTVTDLQVRPVYFEKLIDIIQTHAPVHLVKMGLSYRFPDEIRSPVPLVKITSENVDLLKEMMPDLDVDLPCLVVVKDGRAVSACQSVRISPITHEAGVDTLETYRGRGYATAAVAGWAETVRSLGCIPHYSTAWDNMASQGVARKLGLVLYGADLRIT